ncbi:glycosyltransferase family 2 protein [Flavobacterium sp. SE-s28]|uniref:Glycosyltransferase family 2 protein n=2 Tax=Flavobacterium silvaticum TaxID=1852020 RepID=A0A972JHH0_9FLAO|nr:glycosyltransferase family 2 protein [Flavobacterium silvaticum]
MHQVAVILVNYNSAEHTLHCLKSIAEHTSDRLDYQVVIVDNNSHYDNFAMLENGINGLADSHHTLIRSRINTGFGGGNMEALSAVKAKYLAFVNNDTLFKNDCLSLLFEAMENNPNYGITGGQAYKEDGSQLISLDHLASPGREIFGRSMLEKIDSKKYPNRKKKYTEPVKTGFVPGSFMFVRATDFYAVGGFDTNIFLYYEETDLCKRLADKGKTAWLIPSAEFVHFHGISTPRSIGIKKELKISLLYIIRKHYGFFGWLSVWLFLSVKYSFSGLLKPKNFPLLVLLLKGAPLKESLKQKQTISEI